MDYGVGISRPKPVGWKPKNTLSEDIRIRIINLYHSYNYSKISRITGVSDTCVRKVVRQYLGKE